jgi:uncharacterized membrane protein YcaP (DUF421 family)
MISRRSFNLIVILLRTIILYLIVVSVMRLMGKRQIGELQPYELATAIMISELAAVPMQDMGIPLINGIIPIFVLLIGQFMISFTAMKSNSMRNIICGKPTILVENGRIIEENLRKEFYNLSDLLEQLRINNTPNIADVEFAILETSGQLSVIPKSQKRPVTPDDLKISTSYEGLPLDLVLDGELNRANLAKAGLDQNWLYSELGKQGIDSVKNVLFASLDSNGNLYCQQKIRKRRSGR